MVTKNNNENKKQSECSYRHDKKNTYVKCKEAFKYTIYNVYSMYTTTILYFIIYYILLLYNVYYTYTTTCILYIM